MLVEHVHNLFDRKDRERYIDEVMALLDLSYAYIGGFKGTREELMDAWLWKVVTRHGSISAFAIYKKTHGRKSVAGASNGTARGKRDLIKILIDDINQKRAWSEVSGKMEKIKIDLGAPPIPAVFAASLTGKDIERIESDGYHYWRIIGTELVRKLLVGHPEKMWD